MKIKYVCSGCGSENTEQHSRGYEDKYRSYVEHVVRCKDCEQETVGRDSAAKTQTGKQRRTFEISHGNGIVSVIDLGDDSPWIQDLDMIFKAQQRLIADRDRYKAELEYFVARCEGQHPDGPIHSRTTYARFKKALSMEDEANSAPEKEK